MVDQVAAVVASVLAGIAGGFLSSWMAFNASGEKFDIRKHGNALITGALSGMALGIGAIATGIEDLEPQQIAIQLFTTFLASAGIDRLRSSASRMATPTALNKTEKIPEVDKTTTTEKKP